VRGWTWGALASAVGALAAPAAATERVHVVQQGETLWHIAAQVSGDPHEWPELYRANRDQIKDPSLLYPGQRLRIPEPGSEEAPPPRPAPEPRDEASPGR
jgi:nucleoid-associated protein YgaU